MNNIWTIPAHSHNYETGRRGKKITSVVFRLLRGSIEDADRAFTSESRLASAHYGIYKGIIHKYVDEGNTAFHTEPYDNNLNSIGIIIGKSEGPVSDETYQTASELLNLLVRRYRIVLDEAHILISQQEDLPDEEKVDIKRIIEETKELSPQTLTEKLRIEKDKFARLYEDEKGRNDIEQAKYIGEVNSLHTLLEEREKTISTYQRDAIINELEREQLKKKVDKLIQSIDIEKELFSQVYKQLMMTGQELMREKSKGLWTLFKERVWDKMIMKFL